MLNCTQTAAYPSCFSGAGRCCNCSSHASMTRPYQNGAVERCFGHPPVWSSPPPGRDTWVLYPSFLPIWSSELLHKNTRLRRLAGHLWLRVLSMHRECCSSPRAAGSHPWPKLIHSQAPDHCRRAPGTGMRLVLQTTEYYDILWHTVFPETGHYGINPWNYHESVKMRWLTSSFSLPVPYIK